MRWSSVTIGEVTEVVTKGTTPTTMGRPFVDFGVNFIKAEALNGDSSLDYSGFSFIDDDTHEVLKRSKLHEEDVLITIAGANIGKCGFVRESNLPANTNQAVGIVRIDQQKALPRYIYYFFKQPSTFSHIQGMGGQAAQPNLNLANLKLIKVPLPSRQIQEKTAYILSTYDDLIENNRRRMSLLEDAARQVYQEWFVRLRFPGREHTSIVDGVPKGWERKALNELTSFLKRGITPTYDDDAEGVVINQKCIRDGRLNMNLARRQSKDVKPERIIQVGDVLVNSTGEGTLGRIAQVKAPLVNCTVDTHVTIVRPKAGIALHYFGMAVMEWESRFCTMGKGATNQTELSTSTIGETSIVIPSHVLLEQFELIAKPIYEQVTNLIVQNDKLRAARDLLLPKLMSGEIEV